MARFVVLSIHVPVTTNARGSLHRFIALPRSERCFALAALYRPVALPSPHGTSRARQLERCSRRTAGRTGRSWQREQAAVRRALPAAEGRWQGAGRHASSSAAIPTRAVAHLPCDCHGSSLRVPRACTSRARNAPYIYHAHRPARCSSSRRSALSRRRSAGSR